MTDEVLLEHRGATALVTLNRPHRLNAIAPETSAAMADILRAAARDNSVHTIVLTGSGDRAFCAGADIKWMEENPEAGPAAWPHRQILSEIYPKPVIAAVRGYCLGGGLELALMADIIVAASDASFGFPELGSVGSYPADGGTFRAPRQLPYRIAMDLLLTGRRMPATEALGRALINDVVAPEAVLPTALEKAERINAYPMVAVGLLKELVLKGLDRPLHEGGAVQPGAWALFEDTEPRLRASVDWQSRKAMSSQSNSVGKTSERIQKGSK